MPLFIDIHRNIEGITPEGMAEAHQQDLKVQEKYGVNYTNYWYSESEGAIFCLCEAPNLEAAAAVHKESHGMEAIEILEVKEGK